jgi:hypothetical protein
LLRSWPCRSGIHTGRRRDWVVFFFSPLKEGVGKGGGRWCSRRGWIAEGSIVVVVVVEYMYTASSRLAGWTITCVEREPSEDSISRERRSGHS